MLDMLKARREALKERDDKGFTLAELLIVVAIIAVLVAISIPVFTTQLEKAREATDLSNIRSCYAEAALVVVNGTTTNLGNSSVTGGAITASKNNAGTWTVNIAGFPVNQQVEGWVIDTSNVAGWNGLADSWKPAKTASKSIYTITFTIGADGRLTGITGN